MPLIALPSPSVSPSHALLWLDPKIIRLCNHGCISVMIDMIVLQTPDITHIFLFVKAGKCMFCAKYVVLF